MVEGPGTARRHHQARSGSHEPAGRTARASSRRRRPPLRDRRRPVAGACSRRRFKRVLDRIDAGLIEGRHRGHLPDGSRRRLGFRAPGPVAIVQLNSWLALVRLATRARSAGTRPGKRANGRAPTRCPCSNCSCATPSARRHGPGQGPVPAGQPARPCASAATTAGGAPRQYRRPLRPRQRFLRRLARRRDDLFERGLRRARRRRWRRRRRTRSALLLDRLDLKPASACSRSAAAGAASPRSPRGDYGVQVIGLTLSTEQKACAERRLAAGRPGRPGRDPAADYRDAR